MYKTLAFLLSLFFTFGAQAADILVTPQWLSKHIDNSDVVIIDMSDDPQYQRFHIKTAVSLPYAVLNQRLRNASFSIGTEKISHILGLLGISPESHVVIYDDMGGLNAARLFWELERIGHKKISVLDGGLVRWILEGHPVTNQPFQNKPASYPLVKQAKRHNLATLADVTGRDGKTVLLDVRTQEEYTGHPRQQRSGHIPGALWWDWQNAVDFEKGFRFKQRQDITAQLMDLLPRDKKQPVMLYCRSGHRAAHSYLTLRQLGYQDIRLYDGSMAEYIQQKEQPLSRGMAP